MYTCILIYTFIYEVDVWYVPILCFCSFHLKYLKPKLSPVGRPSPEPAIDTIREVEEPSGDSAEIVSEKESSIDEDSFKSE